MDKWTVLVVEPDQRLNSLIAQTFTTQGLAVFTAFDSASALKLIQKNAIDLVVCEAKLPRTTDFDLLVKVREFSKIPLIILTDLDLESQIIQGFEDGADDYMTKPFNFQELWLRAERLLKYFYQASPFERIGQHYVFPFMTFDLANQTLLIERKEVTLTPREFQLLKYFVEHPDDVISRQTLLKEVWGYELFGEERHVDVHIQKLRKKLDQYSNVAGNSIVTVWGRGYRFTSQPLPNKNEH